MHAFNLQSCEYWGIGMGEPRKSDWNRFHVHCGKKQLRFIPH